MSLKRLRAAVLTPRHREGDVVYLEDAAVTLAPDGTIAGVEPFRDVGAGIALDLRPGLLVPGFVDTHVHYPQTRVVGSASGPLLEWLEHTVFPEELRFHDEPYATAVADEFTGACLSRGTTAVGAFSSSSPRATEILIDAMASSGLRGLCGLTLMDQGCPEGLRVETSVAMAACAALDLRARAVSGGSIAFAVTPRFALSCSRELMRAAGELSRQRALFVQTHVSENAAEGRETLAMHPYARDYLGVYEDAGLIGHRTILAHAIHLSGAEWDRVAEKGARVAHCPDSNFFLNSGQMSLAAARSRGVLVGLGSDIAAGRSLDMRRAICCAYDTAMLTGSAVTAEELFTMATLGGATVLGLGDRTGSIEVGKDADLALLARPAWATNREGSLRCATFAGDSAPVARTFARGRQVYRAG